MDSPSITAEDFRYEGREFCDDCEVAFQRVRCWTHPQHLGQRKCQACWLRATGVLPGIREILPESPPPPENDRRVRGPLGWRAYRMPLFGLRIAHVRNLDTGQSVDDLAHDWTEEELTKLILDGAGFPDPSPERDIARVQFQQVWRGGLPPR